MSQTNQIFSIETLHKELNSAMLAVYDFVKNSDDQLFQFRKNDKWSIAENLEHLQLTNSGVSKLMCLPKPQITKMFGTPEHSSRAWSEMERTYLDRIQKGAKSTKAFLPKIATESTKEALLEVWQKMIAWYDKAFANWTDEELENYQIPHPLLGNMTLREMLHFTVFHTYHHLNAMKRIVA